VTPESLDESLGWVPIERRAALLYKAIRERNDCDITAERILLKLLRAGPLGARVSESQKIRFYSVATPTRPGNGPEVRRLVPTART
jgi:hypothetical protein